VWIRTHLPRAAPENEWYTSFEFPGFDRHEEAVTQPYGYQCVLLIFSLWTLPGIRIPRGSGHLEKDPRSLHNIPEHFRLHGRIKHTMQGSVVVIHMCRNYDGLVVSIPLWKSHRGSPHESVWSLRSFVGIPDYSNKCRCFGVVGCKILLMMRRTWTSSGLVMASSLRPSSLRNDHALRHSFLSCRPKIGATIIVVCIFSSVCPVRVSKNVGTPLINCSSPSADLIYIYRICTYPHTYTLLSFVSAIMSDCSDNYKLSELFS
jgi:hypothetical protein